MKKSASVLGALVAAHLAASASAADGTVKKIDESANKITLDHGPIKSLDMDEPMSMVFKAADPAMLKGVKPGDKVTFEAERVNGQITVTKIRKK
ncbi:copper-binding protein [Chenggangzhangella methanolivorans]|uniref:Copper-binding protein n=1 Tax=Chenggangzhangella methanolivorans TaxID=1437009 RepID=A0A9E6UMS7_9HYPH|nr:copper-binding protein [Chenggangzhangella methanolivorans]QZO02042.1 copper-binding protein [Chenggangzhangella methanolivorans]